jgi:hypothetical protein
MLKIVITAATAFFLASVSAAIAKSPPSACVGLDQAACAGNGACAWREALAVGAPTKAGTPAVRGYKAHCRKAPAVRSTPKPAKAAQST